MTSALADAVVSRFAAGLGGAADSDGAAAMAAYMRDQFLFLGVPSPRRKQIMREALGGLPAPTEADLVAVARDGWVRSAREHQYLGVAYLRRHVGVASPALLATLEDLITTKSWWDTVDEVATHVVGPLVAAHPSLAATMDDWVERDDIWLVRTAILHQERYRERTDAERLFAYCARRASDREFFVRKAIGWALRSYSKVAPDAVRAFVQTHESQLSGLSRREALKWVSRG